MMNKYMGAYIDRRMESLIEEWHIATRHDIDDFVIRIDALSEESDRLAETRKGSMEKLSALEDRARRLEGMKK